jgi:hypothetical protein
LVFNIEKQKEHFLMRCSFLYERGWWGRGNRVYGARFRGKRVLLVMGKKMLDGYEE